MKKLFLLFIIVFLGLNAFAQETGNDSYTIQRLLIYNQNGEVLLEQNDFGWMTPALRHNSKVTIKDGLMNLGSEFGLKVSSPKIAGIFMFTSDYIHLLTINTSVCFIHTYGITMHGWHYGGRSLRE